MPRKVKSCKGCRALPGGDKAVHARHGTCLLGREYVIFEGHDFPAPRQRACHFKSRTKAEFDFNLKLLGDEE